MWSVVRRDIDRTPGIWRDVGKTFGFRIQSVILVRSKPGMKSVHLRLLLVLKKCNVQIRSV